MKNKKQVKFINKTGHKNYKCVLCGKQFKHTHKCNKPQTKDEGVFVAGTTHNILA